MTLTNMKALICIMFSIMFSIMFLAGCVDERKVTDTFIDDLVSEKIIDIKDSSKVSIIYLKDNNRVFMIKSASTLLLDEKIEWRNLADSLNKDKSLYHDIGWGDVSGLNEVKSIGLEDESVILFAFIGIESKPVSLCVLYRTKTMKLTNDLVIWIRR